MVHSQPQALHRSLLLTTHATPAQECHDSSNWRHHALLSTETLGEIKTNFEKRGIPVKPVFLMLDPLERMISSQRRKLLKQGLRDPECEIETLKQRVAKGRGLRGNCSQTLDALDQAFGLNYFIGLFETLFTPGTYAELCSFLGVPYEEPSWTEKINVSATSTVIPDDLLATMGRMHADDLRRAAEALPAVNFQTLWPTTSRWSNS